MKFKVIWSVTAYDADEFIGIIDQDPFQIEGENLTEAIREAEKEATNRFRETYHANDYSHFNLKKLIDGDGIEYPL